VASLCIRQLIKMKQQSRCSILPKIVQIGVVILRTWAFNLNAVVSLDIASEN